MSHDMVSYIVRIDDFEISGKVKFHVQFTQVYNNKKSTFSSLGKNHQSVCINLGFFKCWIHIMYENFTASLHSSWSFLDSDNQKT